MNKIFQKILVVFITIFMLFVVCMILITKAEDEPYNWVGVGTITLSFITITPLLYKSFTSSKIEIITKDLILKYSNIGNYIVFDFSFISKYQSSKLKKVKIKIECDERKINKEFTWDTIIGYDIQYVGENKIESYSAVLPMYEIKENGSISLKASYVNEYELSDIENLYKSYQSDYSEIANEFCNLDKDKQTRDKLIEIANIHWKTTNFHKDFEENLLWKSGDYKATIKVFYDDKMKELEYKFKISNDDYQKIKNNVNNFETSKLQQLYFNTGDIQYYEKIEIDLN